jgi:hypothetical protein
MTTYTKVVSAVLAPLLVVALISCGGGDDDACERHEVEHLIHITEPTQEPEFSTSSATVTLRGARSSDAAVSWRNSAGGNGPAMLGSCFFFPAPFPLPCWQASIPLSFGSNVITVTGEGSDCEFDEDTITITRT